MIKFKTIEWKGDRIRLLDQRRLPQKVLYLDCKEASSVAQAIRTMAIRGAPAIGVAAAMGIALAAKKIQSNQPEVFRKSLEKVVQQMRATRPTAVNLFWAVDRMKKLLDQVHSNGVDKTKARLEQEAVRIYEEDLQINQKIGDNGKILIRDGDGVLTHCNAGGLATAGFGTALGVIHAALDFSLASGRDIPIEERAAEEVTHIGGKRVTPRGVRASNPAFDVTPHSLIHGIITEKGIVREPFHKNLKKVFTREGVEEFGTLKRAE